jgi:two-component sensor histidine kinase
MTNAVKYGALSRDGGKVIASWRLEDGFCRMSWKETGGPRPQPQAGAGFGSRLIEMMASDLGGTVEVRYAPAGIVLDLNFPVDPKAAPRGPAGAAPEIGRRPG